MLGQNGTMHSRYLAAIFSMLLTMTPLAIAHPHGRGMGFWAVSKFLPDCPLYIESSHVALHLASSVKILYCYTHYDVISNLLIYDIRKYNWWSIVSTKMLLWRRNFVLLFHHIPNGNDAFVLFILNVVSCTRVESNHVGYYTMFWNVI